LGGRRAPESRGRSPQRVVGTARLREMIEEALVDAYGESEEIGGFYAAIEEHLEMPFETTLLGIPVTVKRIDLTERDEIVAVCSRGQLRQAIPILDLPLPSPAPVGAEWIEAYRHWVGRR